MKEINRNVPSGISALEAAMALVIILPMVVAFVAVGDYLIKLNNINNLAADFASGVSIKPLKTVTGDNGFFIYMRSADKEKHPYVGSESVAPKTFNKEMDNIFEKLNKRFNAMKLCGSSPCIPKNYRVEFRMFNVHLQTATGRLEYVTGPKSKKCWINNVKWNSVDCKSVLDTNDEGKSEQFEDGNYHRAIGKSGIDNSGANSPLAVEMMNFLLHENSKPQEPFIYAIPSAVSGSQLTQFYGPFNGVGVPIDEELELDENDSASASATMNVQSPYIRKVPLFGVWVRVDYGNSALSKILNTFLNVGDGENLVIERMHVFGPRKIF